MIYGSTSKNVVIKQIIILDSGYGESMDLVLFDTCQRETTCKS